MRRRDGPGGRRWSIRMIAVVATLALALAVWFRVSRALSFDAPDEFVAQKGELVGAELEAAEGDPLYRAFHVTLTSSSGYSVRGHLRVPRERGRWPAVVVIGGVRTGRLAAELFTPDSPYVIVGLDYPWDGPTRLSPLEVVLRVFDIRHAMLLTPSAVMLAVDYLETRPDVDRSDIVLVGASFGAQLITVTGALDPRASSVLIVYGGGDYRALLEANLRVKPLWLRSALAWVGALLLKPIEPLDYIAQIAPRRVILINGLEDDRIPRSSVESLYQAANSPKQMIWLREGHISSRDDELLQRVLTAAAGALGAGGVADEAGPRPRHGGRGTEE